MPKRRKKSASERFGDMPLWKRLVAIGAVTTAIVAVTTAVVTARSQMKATFGQWPYASKTIEAEVASLRLESLHAQHSQIVSQILQLENEMRVYGTRFPQWKRDLLNKLHHDRQRTERAIREMEQRR